VSFGPYIARVTAVQSKRVMQVLLTPATQEAMRADGAGTL